MALPVIWQPLATESANSGRLVEICSFRTSSIPKARFNEILAAIAQRVAKFPIFRQKLAGAQVEDPDLFTMVVDWSSAEEKDLFEPGEEYQSLKPEFGQLISSENPDFKCHHITLPHGSLKTPLSGFYTVSQMQVPLEHQPCFAEAFHAYTRALGTQSKCNFISVAPSREDVETVICLAGFCTKEDADNVGKEHAHTMLKAELEKYVKAGTKYGVVLERLV